MKYKTATDKELWERCQSQNDELAYAEIFRRYFPLMQRRASYSIKNTNEAEELVMDAFLSLWTKREHIIDGNFLNYLFGSVYKLVAFYLRKTLLDTADLELVENMHPIGDSADSGLLSAEIKDAFLQALDKLSPRRKEVFLLSRYENLSYAEIAQKMNLSISTVDNHITAALDSLRTNMRGYYAPVSLLLVLFLPLL